MITLYIGTTDNEAEVLASETETVKAIYEREGKAHLLSKSNITVKVMGSCVKTLSTADLDKSLADLGVKDKDYVVVSENLKGARN